MPIVFGALCSCSSPRCCSRGAGEADPLPSWNTVRRRPASSLSASVTQPGGADFVAPATASRVRQRRHAVSERDVFPAAFAIDRAKAMTATNQQLGASPPSGPRRPAT